MTHVGNPTFLLIAVLVLTGVAVLLLWGGVRESGRVWRLIHHGCRVHGTVVDLEEKLSRGLGANGLPITQVAWCPTVEFATARGQWVRFKPPGATNRKRFRLQQDLVLYYDTAAQEAPFGARLDTVRDLWGGVVVVGLAALLCLAAAAWGAWALLFMVEPTG